MTNHGRTALPWLALLVVVAVTAWLRYGVVEPGSMAQLCDSSHGPWWCVWRHWLVLGFLHDIYGIAAVLTTALAWWRKHLWLAWLATALGVLALQLYCFESGALAVLAGSLRLLRLQAAGPSPAKPHRPRQQQVQAQP